MAQSVKRAFTIEMALASAARISGNRGLAMHYLERAHIVGQRYLFAHLRTHLCMLRLAMQCGDWGEVRGQVARLLAVLPGYVSGWVPVGNPGSARVSPVKSMPIPDDLKVYFLRYSVRRHMLWRGIVLAGCALLAAGIAP